LFHFSIDHLQNINKKEKNSKTRMPSVTDLQQQSSKISSNDNGKSTPPPQQQISSTSTGVTTDTTNADPITQAVLMLEKKQRNLAKRKVKIQ
jgi:hypothetical protein